LISVLSKVDLKILVSFGLIQNFEILDLVIAKVKKVNIAVTFPMKTPSSTFFDVYKKR
jgi:hypothetical protein